MEKKNKQTNKTKNRNKYTKMKHKINEQTEILTVF